MIISDLNYLEVVSEAANVEGGSSPYTYYQNSYNVGFTGKLTVVGVFITGNQAEASSDALALGNNTYSKAATATFATPISSASGSYSVSSVGH